MSDPPGNIPAYPASSADGSGLDLDGPPPRPHRGFLSGAALGLHPGEIGPAWLFFGYFVLLATCHYIGKSVRLSTYVDILGATRLPYAYLLVALVSFPVLAVYSRLARRLEQRLLIVVFSVTQAATLVLFFWLYSLNSPWVALAFYVWTTVAFGIGVSQLWSYANHVFDARQARRVFALIGAGGLLGAIPGGQIASLAGRFSSTRDALLVAAGLSLLLLGVVQLIESRRPARSSPRRRDEQTPARPGKVRARSGWQAVRGSRLLLLIAALVLVSMVVDEMVDMQFGWVVQSATASLGQRTAVFGNFFTMVGVFGFLFQMLFTQRIHRALGVGFGMGVLPLSVVVTSIPLVVAFGMGIVAPIWAAYVLKLCENGFRHSVEQSSRELLFMPVPQATRLPAKSFIDIFVQRAAKGIAAVILLPIAFGLFSAANLSWLIPLVAVAWLWLTTLVRRQYVGAFRDELRSDDARQAVRIDPSDLNTVVTLVESLGSSDPRAVLHGIDLLSANGYERLVPPTLLRHDDPRVRCRTLEVLALAGRRDAQPIIERCLADDDPQVRSCAVRALAQLMGEDASELMAARLADPDPRLRSAAVASLMSGSQPERRRAAHAALAAMASDGDPGVRVQAAKALAEIPEEEVGQSLIHLLYDGDLAVVREAIASIRARMERNELNPLYIPTLISMLGNRRLKQHARQALVTYGERALEVLILFMSSEEEHIWVRRAVPKTVAMLSSGAAADGLIDSLQVRDDFLRRKIIEALAYLRLRNADVVFKASTIARQINLEAKWYLRGFADLWAVSTLHQAQLEGPFAQWGASSRVPSLLQQVLAQRMATAVGNIFRLLELVHPPRDIQAASRSIQSGSPTQRANALEYLDNTLGGTIRRDVFAAIDDSLPEEKLERAAQLYRVSVESPADTLGRLLRLCPEDDPASQHLVFAAIHTVYAQRAEQYYPEVKALAEGAGDPLLRETAEWVVARLEHRAAPGVTPGNADEDEPRDREAVAVTTGMAHIERVVFLQGVDLLGSCNAEQLLQLAAIAGERIVRSGEVIYRASEPAEAMFLIVRGQVRLGEGQESSAVAGEGEAFGVLEILSGQLRSRNATAASDGQLLVIEADDFFDLLSNNIEIVRALFRQLTRPSELHREGIL